MMAPKKKINGNENEGEAEWTPFADAVDEWIFQQSARTRTRWSRNTLAEALGVSPSTVNAWFNKGTLPDPQAFWALVRVTGWTAERLMRLADYPKLPPYTVSEGDFVREQISQDENLTPDQRAEFLGRYDAYRAEYRQLRQRPARLKRSPRATVITASADPDNL